MDLPTVHSTSGIEAGTDSFEVAFLCTGNRSRSPIAAALFARATAGLPVRVSSLGLLELGPVPALPEALDEAARLGLELSSHRARTLAGESLERADLVLGFEFRHVAAAVVEGQARRERAFTLPELVDLLADIDPPTERGPLERARAAVQAAHEARPVNSAVVPEVADPLGRPRRIHRETAERLEGLVLQLAEALFGR
jgi:protein-tyrosine-phosphatase